MADILTLQAALHPEKPALILGDRVCSYADFNRRVNRAAHALAALGLGQGDRVATMAHNSIQGSEIAAAARKLGAVAVPVNFRLREAELAYVVSDSGARVVAAGPDLAPVVDAARSGLSEELRFVVMEGESRPGWLDYERLLDAASEAEPEAAAEGGLGASMLYTSGTTGHPKGAFRAHGVSVERVQEMVGLFGLQPGDVHLVAGPAYHSAVAFFSALTLALGGTLVIMPRFDAEEVLRLISRHRVTTTFMAPILLHRVMDLAESVRAGYDVSSLRALILGAAPCPFSLKERATAYFGEVLWEFYGASETGVNLVLRPEEQLRKPGSTGRVVEGQEVLLLDDAGRPVPDGQPGVLWVRSEWLAEYHGKPEATRHAMRDGFFSVGDIAYRDAGGYYYICDRKIDMIISGGVNIYPAEVEACLHAHPAVRDVAVIGVPDPEWGESVKALVVVDQSGTPPSEQELIDWCRARIADYKRPRSVEFADALPRDAAGKLLKRMIRATYWRETGRTI